MTIGKGPDFGDEASMRMAQGAQEGPALPVVLEEAAAAIQELNSVDKGRPTQRGAERRFRRC